MNKAFALDRKQMRHQFDRAAKTYLEHAIAYQEIAERLLNKLEFIKIQPKIILDIGCGLGNLLPQLKAKYVNAETIGVDLSYAMLQEGLKQYPDQNFIQADSAVLPFSDNSVELIISNLMFPWCDNYPLIFAEIKRVLAPNGLFLFSTLGPDTLHELRATWAKIDQRPRVHVFLDMHDLGDHLLQSGLSDPVMDVEHFVLHYRTVSDLLRDLKLTGSASALINRAHTLLAPSKLQQLTEQYAAFKIKDQFPVTYEAVYGHAWKNSLSSPRQEQGDEIYFPVEWLRR